MNNQESKTSAEDPSTSSRSTLHSKIVFFAVIVVIMAGTSFWYLLTLWAAEPIGPEISKQFAEAFEHECFLNQQDEDVCKKLIGTHHRECMYSNVEQVAPGQGDNGGSVVHDRDGYLSCMREKTGVSY